MHCLFRLSAMWTGALVLSGLAGCALAPEHAGYGARSLTPATAPADSSNYVELIDAGPGASDNGFFHQYSNTFVAETKDGKPAGLFVSADYYESGGFPIYYPYPYTRPSYPFGYKWSGGYGYYPRSYGSYAGSGSSVTAPVGLADGAGAGIVSARRSGRGAGARANSGAVSRSGDGRHRYPPAPTGQQGESGEIMTSKGIGSTPSPYAAAQYRSASGSQSAYSKGYESGRHQSSGQGHRSRPSTRGGSTRYSRGRTGVRWSGQRRW